VDYYFLLQGIFLTQGSNLCLQYWQVDSLPLGHQGSPKAAIPLKKEAKNDVFPGIIPTLYTGCGKKEGKISFLKAPSLLYIDFS